MWTNYCSKSPKHREKMDHIHNTKEGANSIFSFSRIIGHNYWSTRWDALIGCYHLEILHTFPRVQRRTNWAYLKACEVHFSVNSVKTQRKKGVRGAAAPLASLFLSLWPPLRSKRNPCAADSAGKQLSEEAYCRSFFLPF